MTVTRAPWTIDEIDALDLPDGARAEIFEGALHVTPAPTLRHQLVLKRLDTALDRALPEDLVTLQGVAVGSPSAYLIPDLCVTTLAAAESSARLLLPVDVLLAAEVVSPSSRTHDWVTKASAYLRLGVPRYWIIDPDRHKVREVSPGGMHDGLTPEVGGHPVALDLARLFA